MISLTTMAMVNHVLYSSTIGALAVGCFAQLADEPGRTIAEMYMLVSKTTLKISRDIAGDLGP